MLVMFGKRNLRIKSFRDHTKSCGHCGAFDMKVSVYKKYLHFFLIPFFPAGGKTSTVICNSCGQPSGIESLQAAYEKRAGHPVWLYAGLIMTAILVAWIININAKTKEQKKLWVADPQAGDVYLVREAKNREVGYYFLKVADIWGDSVIVYHSNLEYNGTVSQLNDDDYFVLDEQLIYTKEELKQMMEKGELNAVEREYANEEGFNRIR